LRKLETSRAEGEADDQLLGYGSDQSARANVRSGSLRDGDTHEDLSPLPEVCTLGDKL
jgi:hypothetical protein